MRPFFRSFSSAEVTCSSSGAGEWGVYSIVSSNNFPSEHSTGQSPRKPAIGLAFSVADITISRKSGLLVT